MATEQLKVFKNVIDVASTSAVTTAALVTTTSSSQAVVKDVSLSATDPLYPVTLQLKQGSRVITEKTAVATKSATLTLTGNQIIDVSSNLSAVINTGADQGYEATADAVLFNIGGGMYSWKDTNSVNRMPGTARSYADMIALGTLTESLLSSSTFPAYSAFGWMDGATKKFSRNYGGYVYTYSATGTLLQTSTAWSGAGAMYGACTDGTYFYSKEYGSNSFVERKTVSNGNAAANLNTVDSNGSAVSFAGQYANQGSFLLHYNGHLYSKKFGPSTTLQKINTTTGLLTNIAVPSMGNYSAGGLITVASDGTPYLIEVGGESSNKGVVINLNTDTYTLMTMVALSTSTEYGTLAFEITAGVGLFFYNGQFVWVDANTMTATTGSNLSASSALGFQSPQSNGLAASIANIPLHEAVTTAIPRAVTYSAYADGVDIQGV